MFKRIVVLLLQLFIFSSVSSIILHETFDQPDSITKWIYSGDTSVTHGVFSRIQKTHGDEGDFGIKSMNDSSYYHFSVELPQTIDTRVNNLYFGFVMQYEQDIDCGGAYFKLFETLEQEKLNGNSPYVVMFGPDVCGYSTKKTHLIISHKGQNHQMKNSESFNSDNKPHLFLVKIGSDKTFSISEDGKVKQKGLLAENFDYLLPKKIDDPSDTKPSDWVDEENIDDPNDIKPTDWVEEENIPDPDAKKPDDWDDEKDGVWERDQIKNPEYKGEWSPKKIPNPAYKGVWSPRQIDNPDYVEDNTFGEFNVKFIGVDVWTVKSGTVLDDIFISDNQKEAEQYEKSVLAKIKSQIEKIKTAEEKRAEEERKKAEEQKKNDKSDDGDTKDEDDTKEDDDSKESEKEDDANEDL